MSRSKIFILFLLFISVNFSFPQNISDIKRNIDDIITKKDTSSLNSILRKNIKSDNYPTIESYVIFKAKEILLAEDYEYAKSILRIVLNNNLDNIEVQDVFLALDEQEKQRKFDEKKAKEELSKKNKELAKKEKELKKQEKEKQQIAMIKEKEKGGEKTKKKSVISLDNFFFTFNFGTPNFLFYQSQYYTEYYGNIKPNFKYGLSADLSFYFHLPFFATGIDAYFDSYFVDLNEQSGVEVFYKIVSATTTPLMKVPLYLRVGMAHLVYYFDENTAEDIFVKGFVTPTLGLRMRNYYFNDFFGIDGSFDFYFLSFFTSRFDAAFDTSLGFLFKVYTKKKVSLIVRTDLIGTFIIGNDKLENNLKLQISFGVALNEK